MDPWQKRLASQLLGDAAKFSFTPDASAALEIAFGMIRSELTYIVELGRTHKLPVTGNVVSDDIWFKLGNALDPAKAATTSVRFRFDRREGAILATLPGKPEQRIVFEPASRSVTLTSGEPIDARQVARDAIEAVVAAWKSESAPATDAS